MFKCWIFFNLKDAVPLLLVGVKHGREVDTEIDLGFFEEALEREPLRRGD